VEQAPDIVLYTIVRRELIEEIELLDQRLDGWARRWSYRGTPPHIGSSRTCSKCDRTESGGLKQTASVLYASSFRSLLTWKDRLRQRPQERQGRCCSQAGPYRVKGIPSRPVVPSSLPLR
jgi:hypothetical protein